MVVHCIRCDHIRIICVSISHSLYKYTRIWIAMLESDWDWDVGLYATIMQSVAVNNVCVCVFVYVRSIHSASASAPLTCIFFLLRLLDIKFILFNLIYCLFGCPHLLMVECNTSGPFEIAKSDDNNLLMITSWIVDVQLNDKFILFLFATVQAWWACVMWLSQPFS